MMYAGSKNTLVRETKMTRLLEVPSSLFHHSPLLVVLILFSSLLFVPRLYIVILSIHLCCAAMDLPFFCSCNSLISTQCTMHISCACTYCARQCKPKHPFLNKQRFHPNIIHPVQSIHHSHPKGHRQNKSGQEY